ncbi:hypothetical protein [Streptomyces niveus]|uniref:hypothetical protein n=1 Tax=Streptomyces niveus TaxID=193462 RepID=UPI00365F76CC
MPAPGAPGCHRPDGHWALEVDDLDAAFAAWPPADAVRPGNLIALVQPPAAA